MDALRAYKNNDTVGSFQQFAFDINRALVDGRLNEPEVSRAVTALDSAIQHTELEGDLIVYRGCGFQNTEPQLAAGTAHFRGFLSTSTQLGVAFRFIHTLREEDGVPHVLRITYPKRFRHHCYPANDEYEFLLPRDCTFHILDWRPTHEEELSMSILRSDLRTQPQYLGLRYKE